MQLKEEDDLEQRMAHGSDDGLKYDPSNVKFTERGDDEVKLIDEETFDSNDNDEVATIFRIETNVFDFETPSCKAFKEFNYLLQIDPDVLTKDIGGFKTYDKYKDDWIYEWNKDVPWVQKSHGWMLEHEKNPHMLNIIASLFNYKNGCSEWPTCSWRENRYCNGGNLPGAYIVGNSLHYQDLEWYEALKDGELKEEALKNKAIMEGIIEEDYESSNEGWRRWDGYEITNHDQEEREFKMEHNNEGRCELFDDHELSVCNIRKFKMIKCSFRDDEKYVVIKEDEYDDLTSTSKYACRAYQEIFHMMD
uniref:Uncharacterized protein n=1 Tax=Tanacetum cinerariifolium TaxID=118510 RepID=A0A6L2MAQ7_TANCI|nr:hypothetical protein [Tanacetum cinerariifolium]